jgi:hypothetical protein
MPGPSSATASGRSCPDQAEIRTRRRDRTRRGGGSRSRPVGQRQYQGAGCVGDTTKPQPAAQADTLDMTYASTARSSSATDERTWWWDWGRYPAMRTEILAPAAVVYYGRRRLRHWPARAPAPRPRARGPCGSCVSPRRTADHDGSCVALTDRGKMPQRHASTPRVGTSRLRSEEGTADRSAHRAPAITMCGAGGGKPEVTDSFGHAVPASCRA